MGCIDVTDSTFWAIWRNLSRLRELSVYGCDLTDSAFPVKEGDHALIPALTPPAPTLEQLHAQAALSGDHTLPSIEDVMMSARQQSLSTYVSVPARNFEHLRYLDLTALNRLSDTGIANIIANMPRIRNLILAKCSNLTDASVLSVCKLGKHLHYLHLGHVNKSVLPFAISC